MVYYDFGQTSRFLTTIDNNENDRSLVEIEYIPYKIVLHEIRELDNQPFLEAVAAQFGSLGARDPQASWNDGIAFMPSEFPPSAGLEKEKLLGKLHFATVVFTRMETFQAKNPVSLGNQSSAVRLVQITNTVLQELVTWLKNYSWQTSS